jgi:hypothetical protein
MHTGSGPPQVTLRAEVDRICRIAGDALVHAYARISMIIPCSAIRQSCTAKRLSQSRGGQIAESARLLLLLAAG